MWVPGFGVEERAGQRAPATEAHKQVGRLGGKGGLVHNHHWSIPFAEDEPCQEIIQNEVIQSNSSFTACSLPEDTHTHPDLLH